MDSKRETNGTPRQQVCSFHTPVFPRVGRHRRDDKDSDINRGPPNAVLTGHAQQGSDTGDDTEMHGIKDHWELVENETPPYIRAEQAQARREAALAAQGIATEDVFQEPYPSFTREPPTDTLDSAGNRVRVYEHTTARHITFAPGTVPPRPRAPGAPMFESTRRPTPFPLVAQPHRQVENGSPPFFGVERRPTPFPRGVLDLSKMPSQQEIEFQQRADEGYRAYQDALERVVTNRRTDVDRSNGEIRMHTGPLPTHPDGRFKHPPLGWRESDLDERQMIIDEYGVVPWEDQTPYILAAADRRRGIYNPLRPTQPTWEEEDDSDDGPDPNLIPAARGRAVEYPEDEDGDDEASMKQNRPEDDQQRPQARRILRVMNPDPDVEAALKAQKQQSSKPAICRNANVDQAPLYGKLVFDNDVRLQKYDPSHRFHEWLRDASRAAENRDDFFHEWLRAKEAESATKPRLMRKPNFGSPIGSKIAPARSNAATAGDSSSPLARNPVERMDCTKDGKRGAVSPSLSSSSTSWSNIHRY